MSLRLAVQLGDILTRSQCSILNITIIVGVHACYRILVLGEGALQKENGEGHRV